MDDDLEARLKTTLEGLVKRAYEKAAKAENATNRVDKARLLGIAFGYRHAVDIIEFQVRQRGLVYWGGKDASCKAESIDIDIPLDTEIEL